MTVGIIPPLLGAPVRTTDGLTAGTIADLLVEPRTGRPLWAVLTLHDRGEPAVVPAHTLRTRCRTVELPFTRDRVVTAPSARSATELCRHFGVPPWELPPPAELQPLHGASPAASLLAA